MRKKLRFLAGHGKQMSWATLVVRAADKKKDYFLKMASTISADKAYQDYRSSPFHKSGKKSATLETITYILQQNGVEVTSKPNDSVSFKKFRKKLS